MTGQGDKRLGMRPPTVMNGVLLGKGGETREREKGARRSKKSSHDACARDKMARSHVTEAFRRIGVEFSGESEGLVKRAQAPVIRILRDTTMRDRQM
ncbi:hypothetical protein [Nonomuraea jabiensis]|uniref:Uncharacterized protein n=1 Tax=Nonomuraea jabiensis TaxID=882448 RepID=A0A7W9FY32_9ACTN|nr:hypothetical protein [Nonomuraea jabiensis]MBB5773619.1 hypothetical protein [Nonomuraea jabiensis]